jgi:6-pyruvoyltetrahydropterin/6-carboxytetrahydropterin synthase
MLTVTKRFEFCYGHHLPNYNGKCKNDHGHNSVVEVEFVQDHESESCNPYPGMVADFNDIKRAVLPIIDSLDHQTLNTAMPPEYQPPTAENIVKFLRDEIKVSTPLTLIRIRVTETPNSWAEWRADNV